tara:strand:+ start:795 stop:1337 length:543 start_codon:yes stop_codon:yes gene_type:complete
MEAEVKKCLKVLSNGGLILYPTDTVWGIGCDATNDDAIRKVFKLKERSDSKALISIISSYDQLKKLTHVTKEILFEKPTTVIYNNITGISKLAISSDGTAAVRIVKDDFCQKLLSRFNKPIISTSANISTQNTPSCFNDISQKIKDRVEYIVNLRKNEIMNKSSSIIKFEKSGNITIIRK